MTVDEIYRDADLKLHDLRCFEAVARSGSFQGAARMLHRSHPSIFSAIGRLEARLGLVLLDRSGYRVALTEVGRSFHAQVQISLAEMARLSAHARMLAGGEEPVLRVVIGDLCPLPEILGLLSAFFATVPGTRLQLEYEAVGGPAERLRQNTADLVFHRAEAASATIEQIALKTIALVPVAAPGFLPFGSDEDVAPDRLQPFTQCVLRDTARETAGEDHFLIDGAHRCSVPDHAMKRELILQGLGWGHLPDFMVADDLTSGRLIRIGGRHMSGGMATLAVSRRRDRPHGPVSERLWGHIGMALAGLED